MLVQNECDIQHDEYDIEHDEYDVEHDEYDVHVSVCGNTVCNRGNRGTSESWKINTTQNYFITGILIAEHELVTIVPVGC